jgi:hypothetical protein
LSTGGFYFFDGQGAPQGAQAPAKSSGDTARPLDGLVRWFPTIATKASATINM